MTVEFDLLSDPIPENFGKRGRPPHILTPENRNKVRLLLPFDWTDSRIAQALRITGATLRKHYFRELRQRSGPLARVHRGGGGQIPTACGPTTGVPVEFLRPRNSAGGVSSADQAGGRKRESYQAFIGWRRGDKGSGYSTMSTRGRCPKPTRIKVIDARADREGDDLAHAPRLDRVDDARHGAWPAPRARPLGARSGAAWTRRARCDRTSCGRCPARSLVPTPGRRGKRRSGGRGARPRSPARPCGRYSVRGVARDGSARAERRNVADAALEMDSPNSRPVQLPERDEVIEFRVRPRPTAT